MSCKKNKRRYSGKFIKTRKIRKQKIQRMKITKMRECKETNEHAELLNDWLWTNGYERLWTAMNGYERLWTAMNVLAILKVTQRGLFWMKLSSKSPLMNAHWNERRCVDAHTTVCGCGPELPDSDLSWSGNSPSSWNGPRDLSYDPAWRMWENLEPDTACQSSESCNHESPHGRQWIPSHMRSRSVPSWWRLPACPSSGKVLLENYAICKRNTNDIR